MFKRITLHHPTQIIGDISECVTRSRSIPSSELAHSAFVASFEPKDICHALSDDSWVNAMHEELENFERTPMTLSCNSNGSIDVNGIFEFSNSVAQVDVKKDEDNTFKFTPEEGCRLEQVSLNGFDISAMVKNNTLTTTIPENSTMIVTFARESADINGDGYVDISDVVRLMLYISISVLTNILSIMRIRIHPYRIEREEIVWVLSPLYFLLIELSCYSKLNINGVCQTHRQLHFTYSTFQVSSGSFCHHRIDLELP